MQSEERVEEKFFWTLKLIGTSVSGDAQMFRWQFQLGRHEKREILLVNLRQLLKFDEVHPSFAQFTFGNIGMSFAKFRGNVHLRQS